MGTERAIGRPRKDVEDRRKERLRFYVSSKEQAAFLINAAKAGMQPPDFFRRQCCEEQTNIQPAAPTFENTYALIQLTTEVLKLKSIVEKTGYMSPQELETLIDKLEKAVDKEVS